MKYNNVMIYKITSTTFENDKIQSHIHCTNIFNFHLFKYNWKLNTKNYIDCMIRMFFCCWQIFWIFYTLNSFEIFIIICFVICFIIWFFVIKNNLIVIQIIVIVFKIWKFNNMYIVQKFSTSFLFDWNET